jgi:hypothetical protein
VCTLPRFPHLVVAQVVPDALAAATTGTFVATGNASATRFAEAAVGSTVATSSLACGAVCLVPLLASARCPLEWGGAYEVAFGSTSPCTTVDRGATGMCSRIDSPTCGVLGWTAAASRGHPVRR